MQLVEKRCAIILVENYGFCLENNKKEGTICSWHQGELLEVAFGFFKGGKNTFYNESTVLISFENKNNIK